MASIELPDPRTDGSTSVERTIATRESRRTFADSPVTLEDAAQLLWAAQGITHHREGVPMRTAPSAGATYPLECFLEVDTDGVEGLDAGLYRYDPTAHALSQQRDEAIHEELVGAALDQPVVRGAPATIVVAADDDRTRSQYPDHGERYVHMEAGHAAQNVHLVGESLGLASCPVGAFRDAELNDVLGLPSALEALYLLPFGRRVSSD